MSIRRTLAAVTPGDEAEGSGGRKRLWGYGYVWIARLADSSIQTVRQAVSEGELQPEDPVAVVCWALGRRGQPEVAEVLRKALARNDRR